jgi:hypothetical protein
MIMPIIIVRSPVSRRSAIGMAAIVALFLKRAI